MSKEHMLFGNFLFMTQTNEKVSLLQNVENLVQSNYSTNFYIKYLKTLKIEKINL